MIKDFLAGGCSFTYGSELSDDKQGKELSKKTWAYGLFRHCHPTGNFICSAVPGTGNSGIANYIYCEKT